MCTCTTVGVSFVEKSCIRVGTKDHVTGLIDDAIGGIGSNIISKEVNCLFGGGGSTRLLGDNGAEGNQELVVNSPSVV